SALLRLRITILFTHHNYALYEIVSTTHFLSLHLWRGIESDRITTEGFGPDKPIADNSTDEGRTKNREWN
ncbi:MAG: hypothetical protein JW915_01955, partial [Chitinispirillaceae bacterium]|nr:hypothetical protein [Chitinispirillaceae bacterium]